MLRCSETAFRPLRPVFAPSAPPRWESSALPKLADLPYEFSRIHGYTFSSTALEQPAGVHVAFLETEVVPELVQVCDAHLFLEGKALFCAIVAQIAKE